MSKQLFPIFLHVPKCAGTYAIDVIHKHLARINDYNIHHDEHVSIPVKRLTIHTKGFTWSLIVTFLTNDYESDENIRRHHVSIARDVNNPWVRSCDLSTLYYYIDNKYLLVHAGIVEPDAQLDCRVGLYEMFNLVHYIKMQPTCYMCIRESYSKQQSLFHYLVSNVSKHEPTHGLIKCKDMQDYIMSEYMEDSWLIRACTGAPVTTELNKYWYRECVQFIKKYKFKVYDYNYVTKMIENITHTCWGTEPTDEDSHKAHVNKQTYDNVSFTELNKKCRERFTSRTTWDNKLYNTIINTKHDII